MIEYTFWLSRQFKPYVRMTQRSKFTDPKAQAYLASKERLEWQMLDQMEKNDWELVKRGIPLGVVISICPVARNRDLDNEIKAILDAAQGVVFEDDRWVDTIIACRVNGENEGVGFRVSWPI